MFPTFWKCRNISYIFPMCFCSCQKLNCSCILKMQKCFLHFGCRNISSISSKFLQLSKAELFLHFKNVAMFPTFWKCRNISSIFKCVSAAVKSLNCSYILKMYNVSYILEMQEYFQHFQMCFCSCQKLELFLHFKNVEMFPTFWKCRNISYIFPMCFCSCQKLNCSCILKMQKCFLHFGCRNISSISSKFLQLSKA